jgi:hypothetical protein
VTSGQGTALLAPRVTEQHVRRIEQEGLDGY